MSNLRFGLLTVVAAALSVAAMQPCASADLIYDSNGFNTMSIGNLNGQDGWIGVGIPEGWQPTVTEIAPGDNAVALLGCNLGGIGSAMAKQFVGDLATQFGQVQVSFDIFRSSQTSAGTQPMAWVWTGPGGEPSQGMQTEALTIPLVAPVGSSDGATTEFDRFVTVTLLWDLVNGYAYGWYDGNLISTLVIGSTPPVMSTFDLILVSGGSELTGFDTALIDNFSIVGMQPVPEPITLILLATSGAAGIFVRARLRRRKSA